MLPQKSTVGVLNAPLGNTRLQTIHLITAVIEATDVKMNQEILKLNTLSVLLVWKCKIFCFKKLVLMFYIRNYFFNIHGIIFFMRK